MSGQCIVELWHGGTLVRRVGFTDPHVSIGSGPSAMLRIDDPNLAEVVAVVSIEGAAQLLVVDVAGGDALQVNGRRTGTATIKSGGTVGIGPWTLRLSIDEGQLAGHRSAGDRQLAGHRSADDLGDEDTDERVPAPLAAGGHDEDYRSDPVAFVMRPVEPLLDNEKTKKPPVLEVHQIWGRVVLDAKQFAREDRVAIGARTAPRWNVLGVNMGWVPSAAAPFLPMVTPMWSDVEQEWQSDFVVPRDLLPNDDDWLLFKRDLPKEPTAGPEAATPWVAHLASGWKGFVEVIQSPASPSGNASTRTTFEDLVRKGRATKSADGGYEITMAPDLRIMFEAGNSVFFAQMTAPVRKLVPRSGDDVDWGFTAMIAFGAFIFVTVALLMYLSPPNRSNESNEIPDRFVDLLLEKPKEEVKKKEANPDAGEGAKAKKEEGKVGKKEAKLDKAKANKIEIKKLELDRQIAENAGIMAALQGDLDKTLGASGLSPELLGGIGGLIGTQGTQFGSGGLGGRGSGIGGGGTAEGLGGLGTKGMGSGMSGYGSGGGNFGPKGEGGIGTVGGDPIILGALDRSLIDEVIKRHMNEIKYCYQRELTKNPALGGKVVIKFTIAKDGTVSSAAQKSTTMNNAAVENCMVGRFMRMQFPAPKGGGIVIVSYPFLFSPG